MRKANILRKLLNEGKPSFGTHVVTPWPGMFEVTGNSGIFDYVEYVSEYSTRTLPLFDEIGRTMELFPDMAVITKVEEQARGLVATRAIDAGFQGVMFADVRTAQDVRDCIRLVRPETPEAGGLHGINSRRSSGGYGGVKGGQATQDWVKAMNDIVVIVMIEKKAALENLDEILSVKGIDMVQFGPSDYSISVGKPGQAGSPEIQTVEKEVIKTALKNGLAPRAESMNLEDTKRYVEMGVRYFCVGTDLGTVGDWCKKQGKGGIKDLLAAL